MEIDSTITQKSSYEFDGLIITLQTNGHTISDVLEAVENVLRGQGYNFKNKHLEMVEDES